MYQSVIFEFIFVTFFKKEFCYFNLIMTAMYLGRICLYLTSTRTLYVSLTLGCYISIRIQPSKYIIEPVIKTRSNVFCTGMCV